MRDFTYYDTSTNKEFLVFSSGIELIIGTDDMVMKLQGMVNYMFYQHHHHLPLQPHLLLTTYTISAAQVEAGSVHQLVPPTSTAWKAFLIWYTKFEPMNFSSSTLPPTLAQRCCHFPAESLPQPP
ncbi:hypothetical protein ACOSP7_011972 [Xanthoceras sorbifolium]